MTVGADSYAQMLHALLPRGAAWPKQKGTVLDKLVEALASEFARIDARAGDLAREMVPGASVEMMPDWESSLGLPDTCTGPAETAQERRQRLVQKYVATGGQSRQFFIELAAMLGYEITITEYRPFLCGISRCGDKLNGGHGVRNIWSVTVPNPRVTYFRTGVSRCGERLMSIARAEDLECLLSRLKPAHTILVFNYGGV